MKQNAPYGVAALVLGICSIVFSCFFVGLVFGGIYILYYVIWVAMLGSAGLFF